MRHFFVWPSAFSERAVACAKLWKARGYLTCVGLDGPPKEWKDDHAFDVIHYFDFWRGYYQHINGLVREAFVRGNADLVTVGGDDQEPDPRYTADHIAEIYFSRFGSPPSIDGGLEGYGVMQGIGDMQGDTMTVPGYEQLGPLHNAGRICGSPTFGRGWFERGYNGCGPFHDGYKSYYGDEDLWHIAMRAGVLWLNPQITILHNHWAFGRMLRQPYHERAQQNWEHDQKLFFMRRASGFPNMESSPVKKETP